MTEVRRQGQSTTSGTPGFNCTTCGEFHAFCGYVYAHAREKLSHICAQCGAKHEVLNYKARQVAPGVLPSNFGVSDDHR